MRAAIASALIGVVLLPSTVFASHTFTDVPDSNIFHDQISWLAGTGITSGCTPTTYCPGNAVTRGQMAKFLQSNYNIFAGLTSTAHGSNGGDNGETIDTWLDAGISTTVTIPPGTQGRIVATISGEMLCNSGDNTFAFIIFRPSCKVRLVRGTSTVLNPVDHVAAQSLDAAEETDLAVDFEGFSFTANTGVTPLGSGTYTIKVQLMADDNDANGDPADDTLVADLADYHLRADVILVDET
jgi:hypothetical protein